MKLKPHKRRLRERKDNTLKKAQQRKVSDILKRVNETWKHNRPFDAEYR